MGKTKIKIQKIEKESNRRVTFNKRKIGLLKKAYEISILCDVDIVLIFSSQNGEMTCFEGPRSSAEEVVMKFANIPEHERTKSHIQKYTIEENQVSNAPPRKIENEQVFQAAARKLFESHPGSSSLSDSNSSIQMEVVARKLFEPHPGSSSFSDSNRSIQMDQFQHVNMQEIIQEIKDIQRFIGLYDLSLPIEDLVSTSKDAIQMEFYAQRQLQQLQNLKITFPIPAVWSDRQKDNRVHVQGQNFESICIKQECSEFDENVKAKNPMFSSLIYEQDQNFESQCIKQECNEYDEIVKVENATFSSLEWNDLPLTMGLLDEGVSSAQILSVLPELSESSSDFVPSNIEDDITEHEFFKGNDCLEA